MVTSRACGLQMRPVSSGLLSSAVFRWRSALCILFAASACGGTTLSSSPRRGDAAIPDGTSIVDVSTPDVKDVGRLSFTSDAHSDAPGADTSTVVIEASCPADAGSVEDGGSVVDAGTFLDCTTSPCGSGQFCVHYLPFTDASGGGHASCRTMPPACLRERTCACVEACSPQCGGPMCDESDSGLIVTCRPPQMGK